MINYVYSEHLKKSTSLSSLENNNNSSKAFIKIVSQKKKDLSKFTNL